MTLNLLHGGALDRMREAFPDAPAPWIDLSTGINPWPYPVGGIPEAAYHHLPTQAAYERCRTAMSQAFGAPLESLLLSPGSELLIRLLPGVISPERVAILSPTYGDHARAWKSAGYEIVETDAPLDMTGTADAVVLCNPNNPDGRRFDPDRLMTAAEKLAARGGWLIVDEAYTDICPELSIAAHGGRNNLIILRSFGKFFGLAGVRLGALIAPPPILTSLSEQLGVWPVSGPALAIGARAYRDRSWQEKTRVRLKEARANLDDTLRAAGLRVVGGCDLFRIVQTQDAASLWRRLAQKGVYVRRFDCSDHMLRIGLPADPESEQRLAGALTP
tara:strand:+ start:2313 stop:3305 length:993 start_codon:yes stop_codon:yes gene_type:complete